MRTCPICGNLVQQDTYRGDGIVTVVRCSNFIRCGWSETKVHDAVEKPRSEPADPISTSDPISQTDEER